MRKAITGAVRDVQGNPMHDPKDGDQGEWIPSDQYDQTIPECYWITPIPMKYHKRTQMWYSPMAYALAQREGLIAS